MNSSGHSRRTTAALLAGPYCLTLGGVSWHTYVYRGVGCPRAGVVSAARLCAPRVARCAA
jgi:hypothetical protein